MYTFITQAQRMRQRHDLFCAKLLFSVQIERDQQCPTQKLLLVSKVIHTDASNRLVLFSLVYWLSRRGPCTEQYNNILELAE